MAQTWGDTLGSSYASGRAIGEDFASMRFSRKAAKIREEYEQRAATEQVPLDSFLPEIEARLREAAQQSGATRRGVMSRGQTLDAAYGANLRDEFGRLGAREAAGREIQGDHAGAQGVLARNAAARGDFAGAQAAGLAQDNIGATTAAIGPDGQYNMAQGAQGLAGAAARRGMGDEANAQQQGATTFRLQAATAVADQLQRAFSNPQMANPDRIRGMFENLKGNVPELGDTDVQVGDDGTWIIYQGGKAVGSLNPQDPGDQEEFNSMMAAFTQAPGQAVQGLYQTRLKTAEASKLKDSETAKRYSEARIDAIKELSKSTDLPAEIVTKIMGGSGSASGGGGWQLQEIGTEPNTYMVRVGGETFAVRTNVAADPATGQPGGTIMVTTADGKPVPASAMDRAVRNDMQRTMTMLGGELAKGNYEAKANAIRTQLEMLQSLESQERGGAAPGISRGGTRGERNNNPGNIEDRGQFTGNPDYLGSDGRFARFRTAEAGQAAQAAQLERYFDGKTTGQPLTSVQDIVSTWSPQADPTNQAGSTGNYVQYVASRLGVQPGDPLSKADIPRLAQAMGEFESGNTQRGSIASTASRGNVVAGGSDAGPKPVAIERKQATTAPAKRGISREGVLAAKDQLDTSRADFERAQAALQRFDQELGTRQTSRVLDPRAPAVTESNLSPTQQRVRQRLVAELATAQDRMEGATEDTRTSAQALRRKIVTAQSDREAEELYNRYGGAADFVRIAR